MAIPKVFVSYSWDNEDHKRWVREFAERLRSEGVDATLDQWHTSPGDQLPAFMEAAIRENEFVVVVCTPRYKERSEQRKGGVGYEGDILTAEIFTGSVSRKVIPVLRSGDWAESAPSWLLSRYYVDLRGETPSEENYRDLLMTLQGNRPAPPPVGTPRSEGPAPSRVATVQAPQASNATRSESDPIRILGVIVDEVGTPRNDGTAGSGLYAVPFRLSRTPSAEWARVFVETWNRPPAWSTMHRPGIARVYGNKIVLDGTTIEEVKRYHRDTLKLSVDRTNEIVGDSERRREEEKRRAEQFKREHSDNVRNIAGSIDFES